MNPNPLPLVSIIIPTYNSAKYILQTLQSILDQTYNNWEILIIDDGSTDNTEQILRPIINRKIRYFKKINEGVSIARNTGMEKATGEFIAFLDADDFWLPTNLSKKIQLLLKTNYDWVFSDMFSTDENLLKPERAPNGADSDFLEKILLWKGEVIPGPSSNIVISKKCVQDGLRFDPKFSTAADQDFTLYLSAKYKGCHVAEPLWLYRQIGSSMSRNIYLMEKDHIGVYKKAAKNKLFKSYLFQQQCFANMYLILAGSWWVNGNSKSKGLYFLIKASLSYPPIVLKAINKFFYS